MQYAAEYSILSFVNRTGDLQGGVRFPTGGTVRDLPSGQLNRCSSGTNRIVGMEEDASKDANLRKYLCARIIIPGVFLSASHGQTDIGDLPAEIQRRDYS